METYDVIVIGSGPGGYPAAIRAAQLGARAAIIEREWIGGTCLNCGCIPTKALIAGADLYGRIQEAETFGIQTGEVSFDYGAMVQRKDRVVRTLRQGVNGLLKANKVDVYEGQGAFESADRLVVDTADGRKRIKGRNMIIATGSTSALPGFLPEHERVVESRAFLERAELPEYLLVLGGGYIGCELACMAAALGCKVTLVELLDDILLLLDEDVRREVRKSMEKKLNIRILTGHALDDIKVGNDGVSGRVGDQTIEADMLLAAVGRRPVTDGLALEKAGVEANEKGYIPVDVYHRTSVPHIYAIGDVNGGMQLAHAATSQGIYAAEHAVTMHAPPAETLIPGVIFTTPEVALVGLTEAEAKEQGREIKKGVFYFRGLGKALASAESDGFVKWLADARTDQLLGAQAVGPHATDLIGEACTAIRAELTAEEIGRTVHAHPTFAEIWMEAAHALHGTAIHAPPARRMS